MALMNVIKINPKISEALRTVSAEARISGQPIVGYTRIFASGGGMHSLYCAILFGITQVNKLEFFAMTFRN